VGSTLAAKNILNRILERNPTMTKHDEWIKEVEEIIARIEDRQNERYVKLIEDNHAIAAQCAKELKEKNDEKH